MSSDRQQTSDDWDAMTKTPHALADRVQAVEREIASQEVQMNAVRYRAEQAEQQLAAMTAERDEWQNSCEQSRDLVACLRAELAASQARVRVLEERLKPGTGGPFP